MAIYEVKDPFIVPEPKAGKDIDQQYVWDSLPINKHQRQALYDFLVHQKEIDYALLTEMSNRPVGIKVELEDVSEQPSSTLHQHTSSTSPSCQCPHSSHDTESEQKPPSEELMSSHPPLQSEEDSESAELPTQDK